MEETTEGKKKLHFKILEGPPLEPKWQRHWVAPLFARRQISRNSCDIRAKLTHHKICATLATRPLAIMISGQGSHSMENSPSTYMCRGSVGSLADPVGQQASPELYMLRKRGRDQRPWRGHRLTQNGRGYGWPLSSPAGKFRAILVILELSSLTTTYALLLRPAL